MLTTIREEFEHWFRTEYPRVSLAMDEDDQYHTYTAHNLWQAWNAALECHEGGCP